MGSRWNGFRRLVLVDRIKECEDIISFYFKAEDGGSLVCHEPGQFLPFKLVTETPGYEAAIRTYSLSMIPNETIYRISVKKIPGGLVSTYLHDTLQIGECIDAMAPAGQFTLAQKTEGKEVVLISGGIGITPVLSMLYALADKSLPVHFVQAVQNSKMQPFGHDVGALAKDKGFKSTVFYSQPLESDKKGTAYDEEGYITKDWLEKIMAKDSEFYVCGPPVFMKAVESNLMEIGVNSQNIHYELFS